MDEPNSQDATGSDGAQVATWIRSAESGGHRTPLIALTGRVREGERERCRSAGRDDFLGKPMDLELTCAPVEKWVHHPEEAPASLVAEVAPVPEMESTFGVAPAMESAVAWVDEDPAAWVPEPEPAWAPNDAWRELPVLDATKIESSSMGNPELRAMLADAFVARTQQPLARLRFAYGAGDASQVEIHAHALSCLCETLGASRAAALFESIAREAKPERLAGLESWIAGSATEIRLAMEAVEPRNDEDGLRAEAA